MSSTLGLCFRPLMRSDTTADMSDSIAPSMATVIAGEISGPQQVGTKLRNDQCRQAGRNSAETRADRFHRAAGRMTTMVVPTKSATMYPGTLFTYRVQAMMSSSAQTPSAVAVSDSVRKLAARTAIRAREIARDVIDADAEEVA